MAIDFPNTPTTNQIFTVGSRSWKWDGTIWAIYSNNPVLYRQDSPPSSPQEGDQWFETDTGRMFVYYGTAWVELGNATDVAGALQPSQVTALSAVTTLTSDDIFPVVDNPASATATNKITWDNVQSSITSTGTLSSLVVSGSVTSSTDYLLSTKSMPRGIVALGTMNSNYTLTTSAVALSAVTWTAVAGRYYRVTYFEPEAQTTTVSGGSTFLQIRAGATAAGGELSSGVVSTAAAVQVEACTTVSYVTATFASASQTVNASARTSSTTGTPVLVRSSTSRAFLMVEDLGIF